MEAEKVDEVLSWPQPKNVKDIRKFLGLANYYRRFIKDFARVARPMNVLIWKDEKWWWEEAQQKAFDKLKWVFMMKPVLAAPDLDKEFRVEADTSNYATRGVLSMKCSDKKWRPVAFILKSLSDIEQNMKFTIITNGHLLFVMGALILQRAQKCEVRQVTKDVVKSEV